MLSAICLVSNPGVKASDYKIHLDSNCDDVIVNCPVTLDPSVNYNSPLCARLRHTGLAEPPSKILGGDL